MMFTPKRKDGRSLRYILVEALKDADYDRLFTYKDLANLCEIEETDISTVRQAALSASKTLLKLHNRGLKNHRGVGYRIALPREHMLVAAHHEISANRKLRSAIKWYEGADLSKMTDTERNLHHGQYNLAQVMLMGFSHINKRLKRVEDILQGTKTVNQG